MKLAALNDEINKCYKIYFYLFSKTTWKKSAFDRNFVLPKVNAYNLRQHI
jgi:hypothetical protein